MADRARHPAAERGQPAQRVRPDDDAVRTIHPNEAIERQTGHEILASAGRTQINAGRINPELAHPAASPAGLTTANRMFPICVHLNGQNSGTPEFWWSIFFASKFLRRGWIAPKSDDSDFGYFKRAEVGNTRLRCQARQ